MLLTAFEPSTRLDFQSNALTTEPTRHPIMCFSFDLFSEHWQSSLFLISEKKEENVVTVGVALDSISKDPRFEPRQEHKKNNSEFFRVKMLC